MAYRFGWSDPEYGEVLSRLVFELPGKLFQRWVLVLFLVVGLSGFVVVAVLLGMLIVSNGGVEDFCRTGRTPYDVYTMAVHFVISFCVLPAPSIWLVCVAASPHLRATAGFTAVHIVGEFIFALRETLLCGDFTPKPDPVNLRLQRFGQGLYSVLNYCLGLHLLLGRLLALELSSMQDFGAKRAYKLFVVVVLYTCLVFLLSIPVEDRNVVMSLIWYVYLAVLDVFLVLLVIVCAKAWLGAKKAVASVPEEFKESTKVAEARLKLQMRAASCACFFWVGACCFQIPVWGIIWPFPPVPGVAGEIMVSIGYAFASLDTLGNVFFATVLSGAFTGGAAGTRHRASLARARQFRRAAAVKEQQQGSELPADEPHQSWTRKVQDLAGRGVSVDALLKFYRDTLPEVMPSYNPNHHLTKDVVSKAIIPMTADRRCAAAVMLEGGQPVRPDMMVTHQWNNNFRDLLAAVLSDALKEPTYHYISLLLTRDLATLQAWVNARRVGSRSYWICAFAVNQHLGICVHNHLTLDTIDELPGLRCFCGLEKAWNNTPPTLPDGQSIECEMNKFSQMMIELAMSNSSFGQVVVVDSEFRVFKRAWCMAELAEAHKVGMRQELKLRDADIIEGQKDVLRGIRIQDMEAAVPEDKALILSRIEDAEAFNAALRHLLLFELLPAWTSLDAEELMEAAGRSIRWSQVRALEDLGEAKSQAATPAPPQTQTQSQSQAQSQTQPQARAQAQAQAQSLSPNPSPSPNDDAADGTFSV